MAANPSESLLARLKNVAREQGVTIEMAMRRYVHERLLRLIRDSSHSGEFCLKGGVLLAALMEGGQARPTEDIDFNGMDPSGSVGHLEQVLREVCSGHDGADGLRFDLDTLKTVKDRDGPVPGGKIAMMAYIGRTRVPLRVDVGYGNAITPRPVAMELPAILPSLLPPSSVNAYPMETTIAEKLHAMHRHGEFNTRIKDYFDIWRLSLAYPFDGSVLAAAIRNTFVQHGDEIPEEFDALGEGFSSSASAHRQWKAFTSAVHIGEDAALGDVIEHINGFVLPAAHAARGDENPGEWNPDSGWSSISITMAPH